MNSSNKRKQRMNILIVHGDRDLRYIHRHFLEKSGHTVREYGFYPQQTVRELVEFINKQIPRVEMVIGQYSFLMNDWKEFIAAVTGQKTTVWIVSGGMISEFASELLAAGAQKVLSIHDLQKELELAGIAKPLSQLGRH